MGEGTRVLIDIPNMGEEEESMEAKKHASMVSILPAAMVP